jgi:Holliday junction resolvase
MINEFEDSEDFILEPLKPKRKDKVNGKRKGNRVELDLTKVLNKRFGQGFSRSVGSGNRWSQVKNLSEEATQIYSGDLVTPKNFKFVIESKGGYDAIDMSSIFICGNSEIDKFLEQVTKDSKRCGKKPMLCWKKNHKPWLVFIHTQDLVGDFKYKMQYGKWSIVALDHFLKLNDDFFLDNM